MWYARPPAWLGTPRQCSIDPSFRRLAGAEHPDLHCPCHDRPRADGHVDRRLRVLAPLAARGRAASGRALAADASGDPDVFRLGSLLALRDVELDLLPFLQPAVAATRDRPEVHEHVRAALHRDETVALIAVEPLQPAPSLTFSAAAMAAGVRADSRDCSGQPVTSGAGRKPCGWHGCRAAGTTPPGQGAKAAEANTWAGCTRALHRRSPGMGATTGLAIPGRGKFWAAWRAAHRGLGCPAEWSP